MVSSIAELTRWTPVSLNLDPPASTIDWCDLGGERFTDPFFDQTVNRRFTLPDAKPLVRTPLEALLELDSAPSLEPSGIIFHLSRCGSTLATRLLSTIPGVVTIVEPEPINTLLGADPSTINEDIRVAVLRLLVRAMGRVRLGDERKLIVKLSSWNVRRGDLVRRAFPDVPLLWMQRSPIEVASSLLARPPGWFQLRAQPDRAASLFGMEANELSDEAFCCRSLRAMLESASGLCDAVVDYTALPDAIWNDIAPRFGIELSQVDIEQMRAEARFDAKTPGAVPFDAGKSRVPKTTDFVTKYCAEQLQPLYALMTGRAL